MPLHFNADGQNINDLKVCILKGKFKDIKHRKLTELQFINNFEAIKFDFNENIFFLSKYDTSKHKGVKTLFFYFLGFNLINYEGIRHKIFNIYMMHSI